MVSKTWKLFPEKRQASLQLEGQLGVSSLVAKLLINRCCETVSEAKAFLYPTWEEVPSPFLLPDIEAFVERVESALKRGEKICILGDYDVDGMTGTALFTGALRDLGADVFYSIPDRLREGYGLNKEALRIVRERGATLAITADNGIGAVAEARFAKKIGLDLLVTDHHEPGEELPAAVAIVNPKRKDALYPDKNITGVGVAFQCLLALRKYLRDKGFFQKRTEINLRSYLDIVALGTIADVVPLRGVNRLVVKEGLQLLREARRIGMDALLNLSDVNREKLDVTKVAFGLIPKLNACGRVGDPKLAVELLLSKNMRDALDIGAGLIQNNKMRISLQKRMIEEASTMTALEEDSPAIVIGSSQFHPGIIGIVAARLAEQCQRSTAVVAFCGKEGRGSIRAFGEDDVREALASSAEFLVTYGGHAGAAGFTIEEKNFPSFKKAFAEAIAKQGGKRQETLSIDCVLEPEALTEEVMRELSLLEPHGEGNESPLFEAQGLSVKWARIVGNNHLKLSLTDGRATWEAIAFGWGKRKPLCVGEKIDIAYHPEINHWQGSKKIQLNVQDLRPASSLSQT